MVKTPRTRHSKTPHESKTIDLEPGEISRSTDGADEISGALEPQPSPEMRPDVESAPAPAAERLAGADAGTEEEAAIAEAGGASSGAADMTEPSPATEDAGIKAEWRQARADPDQTGTFGRQPDARPAATPAAAERRPGRILAAGILGGLVALAGGGLLQFAGLLGTPGGTAPGLDGVETEIASLRAEIAELRDRPAEPAADAGLSGRVDGLAGTIDRLGAEMASLQQSVRSSGGDGGAAVSALDQRIAELETSVAGLAQSPGSSEEVASLNERIAGIDSLVKAAGEADAAFEGRLGAVEQRVSELGARVDAQAAQPEIALAIAAAALKSAIESGEPFEAEIETFAAVAPDTPEITGLRAHAEAGVATRAEIIADTEAAADAMIRAADPPPQDAGLFERLLSSAESLVTVRPIGAVEGAGVPEPWRAWKWP